MAGNWLVSVAEGYPEVYLGVVLVSSLVVMILSSDKLLFGVTRWAKHLGLSDYVVGMVIVALAASLPELASSIMGIGDIGIVFGTIVGSNLGGLTLLLGTMGILGGKVSLHSKLFHGAKVLILLIVSLPFLMILDGELSRIEGSLLIVGYVGYLYYIWEGAAGGLKPSVKFERIWKSGLIFLLALVALLLSARWLILSSVQLSVLMQVPAFVVVVFVVGIGAQVPDLIVVLRSQLQHHGDVGVGDLLGSTITKALLFLGIIALIQPLSLSQISPEQQEVVANSLFVAGGFFMVSMILLMLFMRRGYMTRNEGIGMVFLYFLFVVAQILVI